MKMFSDCSGNCILCGCYGCCLAGHGDDDFIPASDEDLQLRLAKGKFTDEARQEILDELKRRGVHVVDVVNFDSDNPKLAANSNSSINIINDNDYSNYASLCNINDEDGKLFNEDRSTLKIELDSINDKSHQPKFESIKTLMAHDILKDKPFEDVVSVAISNMRTEFDSKLNQMYIEACTSVNVDPDALVKLTKRNKELEDRLSKMHDWVLKSKRYPDADEFTDVDETYGESFYRRLLIAYKTDTLNYAIGYFDGNNFIREYPMGYIISDADVIGWKILDPCISDLVDKGEY